MEEIKKLDRIIVDDTAYETKLTHKYLRRKPYTAVNPKKVCAFIPGIITKVNVYEGQKVNRGQSLLILEAMKMMNDVICPLDGRIKSIFVKPSEMVTKGQLLIELE